MRIAAALLVAAVCAFAANVKLYLKDGGYHIVKEYKVLPDRVRFYSVERSQWEEMPLELVDLKRTEAEIKQRQEAMAEETKIIDAEEKVERQLEEERASVPQETGAYFVAENKKIKTLPQAESKVHGNKRRSILKAMAPIPIVSGKAVLELDGEHSPNKIKTGRPEFYIRLSTEERFGIVRLTPQKGVRIVENLTIVPVTKEIIEDQNQVEIFRKQVDDRLYKIWPAKPLTPGEYAVVEYTEGKLNIQIWDFQYDPAAMVHL